MLEYNGERAKKKREQRAERRIKSTNKCKRGITAFVYLKISHMHSNYPWYFKSVRPKRPGIQIGCNFRPFPLWMRQKSIVNIQKKRADDGNTLNNAIHCNLSHIRTIPAQKRSNKTTMVDEKKKMLCVCAHCNYCSCTRRYFQFDGVFFFSSSTLSTWMRCTFKRILALFLTWLLGLAVNRKVHCLLSHAHTHTNSTNIITQIHRWHDADEIKHRMCHRNRTRSRLNAEQ